jgi:hypothetical protein
MRRSPRNGHPRLGALASRIDHAAGEINPFLVVIAVGLVVLNLIALVLHTPRLSLTRIGVNRTAAAAAPPASRLGGLQ